MKPGQDGEKLARYAIETQYPQYQVHDANIIFRQNCPNIDIVVFHDWGALYVQVKTSSKPAGRDCVIVDGSTWTRKQLVVRI